MKVGQVVDVDMLPRHQIREARIQKLLGDRIIVRDEWGDWMVNLFEAVVRTHTKGGLLHAYSADGCPKHKSYTGSRRPQVPCAACEAVYAALHEVEA